MHRFLQFWKAVLNDGVVMWLMNCPSENIVLVTQSISWNTQRSIG